MTRILRPALLALLVPALATPPLLTSAGPAAAAAQCRGQVATIEASDEELVTGTDGDDVIVVQEVSRVEARGGRDLVCVTAPGGHATEIDSGAGDDEVETTATGNGDAYYLVRLGSGDDEFYGGIGLDTVTDGDRTNVGQDEIDTGAGDDIVISGRQGAFNLDVVRLGAGHDSVRLRGRVVGPVDGGDDGSDDDVTFLATRQVRYDVDLLAGTARIGGDDVVLPGFTAATIPGNARSITLAGTPGLDRMAVSRRLAEGRTELAIDLGGGSDSLAVVGVGTAAGTVDLGPGSHDRLWLDSGKGFSSGGQPFTGVVTGTLTGRLDAAGGALDLAGVEDFRLTHFRRVALGGNAARNVIDVSACFVEVAGGMGDDRVSSGVAPSSECPGRDGEGSPLRGQAGDDRLEGTSLDDVLIGGPGRDRADGGTAGDDVCAAETTLRCG